MTQLCALPGCWLFVLHLATLRGLKLLIYLSELDAGCAESSNTCHWLGSWARVSCAVLLFLVGAR